MLKTLSITAKSCAHSKFHLNAFIILPLSGVKSLFSYFLFIFALLELIFRNVLVIVEHISSWRLLQSHSSHLVWAIVAEFFFIAKVNRGWNATAIVVICIILTLNTCGTFYCPIFSEFYDAALFISISLQWSAKFHEMGQQCCERRERHIAIQCSFDMIMLRIVCARLLQTALCLFYVLVVSVTASWCIKHLQQYFLQSKYSLRYLRCKNHNSWFWTRWKICCQFLFMSKAEREEFHIQQKRH